MNTEAFVPVSFKEQSTAYRILEASQLLSRFMPASRADSKYKDNWIIIQALYASSPERFVVTCGIHQNNTNDKLHFSINLKMNKHISVPFHFNGYMTAAGGFFISEVTRLNSSKQTEIVFVSAERFPCNTSE